MSSSTARTSASISALLHPLWLAALAVLALNDHVIKGSGLLPGSMAGKLSDFAGLLVAPLLLSAIVLVRTRAGWTAAHVVVGVVFGAIQLWPSAAEIWAASMGVLGFPWHITMDPTDLIALPALVASHHWLRPTLTRSLRGPWRRTAEYGAAGAGLLACVATSPPPGPPVRASITTDVYVHNAGDADLVVRIRRLSPSADIDCALVAADPGRLLSEPLFGPATSWTVPPGVNHGLYGNSEWDDGFADDEGRDCRVVLLDADNVPPAIVFWQVGDPPMHVVDGEGFDAEDPGAIELVFDDDGQGRYGGAEGLVFMPVTEPPSSDVCAPQADGDRLDWSDPVPQGGWTLASASRGFDGCWALDLVSADGGSDRRWYVCAPIDMLPFAEGDAISISQPLGDGAPELAGYDALVIERATSEAAVPSTRLHLTRGATVPAIDGLQFAQVPEFDCAFATELQCGTAARAASLTVGGSGWTTATLRPGDPVAQLAHDDGSSAAVWLTHAQDRIALDPECADGPDTLGVDLEVVAVVQSAP